VTADVSISSSVLPDNRNFTQLKAQGLDYLKHLSGSEWTDFNESDPGVTILDQLCYALTELGYCNDFPIEDIVCRSDGEIQTKDQFFKPEKILTSAPVVIDDYRKIVIDEIPQIKNVYISFDKQRFEYHVYLYIDDTHGAQFKKNVLCKVDQLLDRHRTVGEYFAPAIILEPLTISLTGKVLLDSSVSVNRVYADIKLALEQYVSPKVKQYGYKEMLDVGYSSDQIFDGPQLNHGWIPNSELAIAKRDTVSLHEILSLIFSLKGVISVSDLRFDGNGEERIIELPLERIASFDISDLAIASKGATKSSTSPENVSFEVEKLRAHHAAVKIGSSIRLHPRPPSGKYRNIGEYYSIQNTFPSIYGLGADSLQANTSSYRVAQSRQLKGYLMIFDQLIADQFSQLDKVSELFSFKPWGRKTDIREPKARPKDKPDRHIPSRLLSPTYYFQPLYDVPDVKPLLIGNDSYLFSDGTEEDLVEQEQAWTKYKRDPFNQYLSGLRDCIENETQSDFRHNQMLNHLLARHGESGDFYDDVIHEAHWYGSVSKSRIIIKSVLLQNYHLLSYKRCKAYDCRSATRLGSPGRFRLTKAAFERITIRKNQSNLLKGLRYFINRGFRSRDDLVRAFEQRFRCKLQPEAEKRISKLISDGNVRRHEELYRDGQLDLNLIESNARLHPEKFINYSSSELLLNLVLQLSQRYKRLSSILLVLLNSSKFSNWLKSSPSEKKFAAMYQGIRLTVMRKTDKETGASCDQILLDGECVLRIAHTQTNLKGTYQAHIDQLDWLAEQRQGQVFIENVLLLKSIQVSDEKETIGAYGAWSFFPGYVNYCRSPEFAELFFKLVAIHVPAYVTISLKLCSHAKLSHVIESYIAWHNWLRLKSSKQSDDAQRLASWISQSEADQ